MGKKHILYDGIKSSILWDEETDAWTYLSGQPVIGDNPHAFYKVIPTLFRAVDIRATSVATMPWALMKGETEYETSETFENKTGLVGSMFNMFYLMEAALVLTGRAYWKRETNKVGYSKLRHLEPNSLQLDETKAKSGELVWKRNENGVSREYTPEEIIYLWGLDPYVEIGPPSAWPVKSALNACGVLGNMDEFAKNYFGRGAIKAMLFAAQGASLEQKLEFETWWNKFIGGIKNAFQTKVINAEKVTPIIVGEGIKELENVTLSQEKREEIALAMGIPMSLLFANAANYATANQDKRNWYEDKVIPEAQFIAGVLNEQVFEVLGLKLVFRPETLNIMQEDEKERSMALGYLNNADVPLDIAMRILGFDLTDEQWVRIEEMVAKKEEQAEELTAQLTEGGEQDQGAAFQPEDPKEKPDPFDEKMVKEKRLDYKQIQHEMTIWRDKCLKAIEKGKPASTIDFIPAAIPGDVYDNLVVKLDSVTAEDMVKDAFVNALRVEPEPQDSAELTDLVKEFKNMADAIIWKGYP